MLTLAHPKAARNSNAAGGRTSHLKIVRPAKRGAGNPKSDEISLVNSIGAAASRDLSARAALIEEDEAALVNAVARAAARSLAS